MVALTDIQAEIVRRVGPLLTDAGLASADLLSPIGRAVEKAGGSLAGLGAVTQADLDTVPDSKRPLLLDLAQVYALETVLDHTGGAKLQALDLVVQQDHAWIASRVASLWARISAEYGVGSDNDRDSWSVWDLQVSPDWSC